MSAAQHTPTLVRLFDLPLGSMFRYEQHASDDSKTFVLLDRAGCGLCAEAPHRAASAISQGIYSIAETADELREMRVVVVRAPDELVAALDKLAHYAECQVAAFKQGRPYLDMTLFPSLCKDARAAIAKATGSAE